MTDLDWRWLHTTARLRHAFLWTALLLLGTATTAQDKHNVLVIISDDAGFADFGFQGSKKIPTPHLDALAARGVAFRHAYAGSVCSPSRAMLTTGMYTSRIGYSNNIPNDDTPITQTPMVYGLPLSAITIWERMQQLGYTTGAIGKWHLGAHPNGKRNGVTFPGNRPQNQGVEYFHGLIGGSRSYWGGKAKGEQAMRLTVSDGKSKVLKDENVEDRYEGQYITDTLGDLTVDYIRKHHAGDRPFFLYSSFTAPHVPMHATKEDLKAIKALGHGFKPKREIQAAMQLSLDRNVGKIVTALDDPNGDGDKADSIFDKTLVIFVNDNGGDSSDSTPNYSSNWPLRHGKGSQWEGGIRVPMLIAGGGLDEAYQDEGVDFFEHPVHVIDILPTAMGAGGGKKTKADVVDGVDLVPYLNDTAKGAPHESLYLRRYSGSQNAVRMGAYKLMYRPTDGFRLYNLHDDPGEKTDLSKEKPDLVEQMKRVMTDYDVVMDKSRHDNLAPRTNQFSDFRFREGAFERAKWSAQEAWIDSDKPVVATLSERDAYANAVLVFRNRVGSNYTATNDMFRVGGLDFMANDIRFVGRSEPLKKAGKATIDGRPVLLTQNLKGKPARLSLNASFESPHTYSYDLALDVKLYSNLLVSGNGNQDFVISGKLLEYRPGRSLKKTGSSTLTLKGQNDLTGTIRVQEGKLVSGNGQSLGRADLHIGAQGVLAASQTIELGNGRSLSGSGQIDADVMAGGPVKPGSAQNPLRVQGDLSLQDRSTFTAMHAGEKGLLEVAGTARLEGALSIAIPTEQIKAGDRITLIRAEKIEGRFALVRGLTPTDGLSYELEYRQRTVSLRVVATR